MNAGWRSIRFQADEDLTGRIVRGLRRREPGIDVLTAAMAGLIGQKDPAVLAYAADHGRLLDCHDRRTMPGHFADFLATGRHSPGVILIPQAVAIGAAIDDVLLIWEASGPDEWVDTLTYLPL